MDKEPAVRLNNINTPYPPNAQLGYVRGRINQTVLKILCDSGNLGPNVMSNELAQSLGLQISELPSKIELRAANGSTVHIMGQVDFSLQLENSTETFALSALVCKNVESLNLGNDFLRKYAAALDFSTKMPVLRVAGQEVILRPRNFLLNTPTTDKLFEKYIKNVQGVPPHVTFINLSSLEGGVFRDIHEEVGNCQRRNVRTQSMHTLPPNQVSRIEVNVAGQDVTSSHAILFTPKTNSSKLIHKSILPLGGVYPVQKGKALVQICNLSDKAFRLNARETIGGVSLLRNTFNTLNELEGGNESCTDEKYNKLTKQEKRGFIKESLKLDENDLLDQVQKEQIVDIFEDNWAAVSQGGFDLGRSPLLKFKIRLKEGAEPHRARLRPLNPDQAQDLDRQLDEWLDANVIEPSESEWAAALVPVKKKLPPGEAAGDKPVVYRWAVDYRPLNKVTIKDAYPIPLLNQNIENLAGNKIFSSLDAASAYHCVEIEEQSRPLTAFVTPRGLFQFRRMAFGLANAPASYCRLVQMALDRIPSRIAIAYLDDILVMSKNVTEHINHLRLVLELHANVGLKLNMKKCSIVMTEVDYLGHKIGPNGISMMDKFIQKIQDWPTPTTGGELRSFLGFVNYYRAFIPDFTKLTANLNKLRSTSGKIELSKDDLDNIKALKAEFAKPTLRSYPDFESGEPFILETDWSAFGVGGVLKQKQGGTERFIACASRANNKHESKYAAHKGELCALIYCCKKWEHMLSYRPFIVRTDSTFLLHLDTAKDMPAIYYRWLGYLSRFDLRIQHKKGSENPADGLSRVIWPSGLGDDVDMHDLLYLGHVDSCDISISERRSISAGQLVDSNLQRIKEIIEKHIKLTSLNQTEFNDTMVQYLRIFDRLVVINQLVCYVNEQDQKVRVCVPSRLIAELLHVAHAGHSGITETYNRLKVRFYWPYMKVHVEQFISSCQICAGKTNFLRKPAGYFKPIFGRPNYRVAIDFVGPLPRAMHHKRPVQYVCTIMDMFSRYVVALPTRSATAESAITVFLDSWVYKFGPPNQLHSDRGQHFCATIFREMCNKLHIAKTYTIARNPTGNSKLERVHSTLKSVLRGSNTGRWPSELRDKVFYYNISIHRITKFSPFELFFGRLPVVPLDAFSVSTSSPHCSGFELLRSIEENCHKQCEKVVEVENKIRFKALAKLRKYTVGERVWYFSPANKKMSRSWTGPYTVTEIINEAVVIISDTYGSSIRCNTSKIKPFHDRKEFLSSLPGNLQYFPDDEDEYVNMDNSQGGEYFETFSKNEPVDQQKNYDSQESDSLSCDSSDESVTGKSSDEIEIFSDSQNDTSDDTLPIIDSTDCESDQNEIGNEEEPQNLTRSRSTREAAVTAADRIKELFK